MAKKNKIHAKLYEKYMNTNFKFEKDGFNYFKSMYEQKLQDPDFNIYVEQCKLTLRANSAGVNSSLGMYVSSYISLGTFLLGAILGKYILLNISLAIVILLAGIFVTLIMKERSSNVDVWNTALIALEAAYIEKTVK
jgi:type IV secretory pathway VirB6-like protein